MATEHRARVVKVDGALKGGEEIPALKMEVDRLVESGSPHILLDMRAVSLINSLGIGALISCLTRVRKRGGEMKLLGASQRVLRALETCRFLDVCEHYDDQEQALRSFDSHST